MTSDCDETGDAVSKDIRETNLTSEIKFAFETNGQVKVRLNVKLTIRIRILRLRTAASIPAGPNLIKLLSTVR